MLWAKPIGYFKIDFHPDTMNKLTQLGFLDCTLSPILNILRCGCDLVFGRAKEAENEARRLAASAREAAARTAFGIARRQREEELDVVRANVERKAAHLEAQAASFRNRQKVR